MKNSKQLCAMAVLMLVLAIPAFAGGMETPFVPPPPPVQSSATVSGDMSTPETSATDSITDAALNLLQSVLAIL